MIGVRTRVRDDEVGCPQRVPVDRPQRSSGHRAVAEAPTVGHERVGERDERVEDDRPAASRPAGGGEVEVARVADDEGVEIPGWPP